MVWSGSVCLFFFSSRRRHTRCLSDWSSDVCSSDLRLLWVWIQASMAHGTVGRITHNGTEHGGGEKRRYLAHEIGRASCRERMYTRSAAASVTRKKKGRTRRTASKQATHSGADTRTT